LPDCSQILGSGTAVEIERPTPVTGVLVLGIDAAWTAHQPSGVALVQQRGDAWSCGALAPSYESFIGLADGRPVDWAARPHGCRPDIDALLGAAERLGGRPVDLIAFDMPLSTEPIGNRRAADREVSRLFGKRGCAVHSPMAQRPGAIADRIRLELQAMGYPLHTAADLPGPGGVIEVYPHVALLALLQSDYRVPYKVSRSLRYWKAEHVPASERIRRLLAVFQQIRTALDQHIGGIPLPLPEPEQVSTLAALKPLEDSLDAMVCAWVGMEHLQGRTRGLGDASAAIWCPDDAFRSGPHHQGVNAQLTSPG
jgi:predicted RNase H-like nuclease